LSEAFRDAIADAERSRGYGEARRRSTGTAIALGRYRLQPPTLQRLGVLDDEGRWTGKNGAVGEAEFLANPDVQEAVLRRFFAEAERQAEKQGLLDYLGREIAGQKAKFRITLPGLMAAVHRAGLGGVEVYLRHVRALGWSSRGRELPEAFKPIETRLRLFEQVPYRPCEYSN
jgi:hypothetical protein